MCCQFLFAYGADDMPQFVKVVLAVSFVIWVLGIAYQIIVYGGVLEPPFSYSQQ